MAGSIQLHAQHIAVHQGWRFDVLFCRRDGRLSRASLFTPIGMDAGAYATALGQKLVTLIGDAH